MNGLLHFKDVPRHSGEATDKIGIRLMWSIRAFCDTDHGRMIPLEDQCYRLLSWYSLAREHSYLVRVADVTSNGKPFASIGFAAGLLTEVCDVLTKNGFNVIDASQKDVYDHFYSARTFKHTDFFYIPDSAYCKTVVARRVVR